MNKKQFFNYFTTQQDKHFKYYKRGEKWEKKEINKLYNDLLYNYGKNNISNNVDVTYCIINKNLVNY